MSTMSDTRWFDRFAEIFAKIGETYEMLEPLPQTLSEKRSEFESSGYSKNISLLSDRVSIEKVVTARQELESLRKDIEDNETNDLVKWAYLDAISVCDANARLIIAGAHGDKLEYANANSDIYDDPDMHVFKAVCHWIRQTAEQSENNPLASRVLELIPALSDDHQMLIPTEEVFHKVRELHREPNGYYDKLFGPEGLPTDPYIDQEVGDEICKRLLTNIGSDYTIVSSDNNNWATMKDRRQLVRPSGYRLDRDEFIGMVSHEIGSHILEFVNGEKSPLKLLSLGLARYDHGNEGRAFLREQIVYEHERVFLEQFAWEYIVLLHLAVSLAAGVHEKPYTFAELYEVLFSVYSFWRERRMPHATNNEAFARNEAWFLTVRVMKGTDGTGGAYLKDTVYLESNIRCWQAAAKDPSIILFGDKGKFDITNPDHLKIVQSVIS
jgi:hypothetical protein